MTPALDALLGHAPQPEVLADTRAHTSNSLTCAAATAVDEDALIRALARRPVAVVIVETCSPRLLRQVRSTPPTLLVVTGATAPERVDCPVLGPRAQLHVNPTGALCVFAPQPEQLTALRQQVAPTSVRLAISPVPGWLPAWFEAPKLAQTRVVGLVPTGSLSPQWARWFRRHQASAAPPLVVPLGPAPPDLDNPDKQALLAASCAHTLESCTGPLAPLPQLLARLAVGEPSTSGNADLWRQTRRALPLVDLPTPLEPTAGDPLLGLLAARARARGHRAQALLDAPEPELEWPDDHLQERSLEVLRSAGEILSDHESKVVLRGFGIEITRQAVAASASGAVSYADKIGYPVVLKAVSPDLRRKREFGALKLDLQTAASVRRGYAGIVRNLEQQAPHIRLDGVAVCEQIAEGPEFRCGAIALEKNVYAFFLTPLGRSAVAEPALALAPLDWPTAMLLAGNALASGPAMRRRADPQPQTLAEILLRLDHLLRAADGRLLRIDLHPVRLLADPQATRPYVTLDARITQKPHLEGL